MNEQRTHIRRLRQRRLPAAGTAFSRWSTEATVMQEFKQYGHYMQPRIHKMIQEVTCWPQTGQLVLAHPVFALPDHPSLLGRC